MKLLISPTKGEIAQCQVDHRRGALLLSRWNCGSPSRLREASIASALSIKATVPSSSMARSVPTMRPYLRTARFIDGFLLDDPETPATDAGEVGRFISV
ncbi:hypothetical protein [Mesorhizobium silamurunense]|uniref:hypothetical protein n=1 Tax=Mesorhizobium silamurunense TaxID=499528 RepID=UPI00177E9492|nr:hypothetical protein [Mesorhizobium silamurunense]